MKSKITTKAFKIVLTYGITSDTLNSLLEISKKYGIVIKQVMPSELDIKISQLLRTSQLNLEQYPINCDTCMLMANFDKSTMDKFLKDLKSNSINIPLKAVLTPTNQTWSFNKLLENLKLEHQRFSNR